MSRQPRFVFPGQPQHVIQRGNNRDVIFVSDDDYRLYLYKATLLDSESYLLSCYRYIELNPVRAGMVDHPSDYQWSGYACNASGKVDPLITLHERYLALDKDDEVRRSEYRALFDCHVDVRERQEIREATNKSWVLGSDRFKEAIEALTARQTKPKVKGGDRKSKKYRERAGINRV